MCVFKVLKGIKKCLLLESNKTVKCTYNVTWKRVRVTTAAVGKQYITYSECAFVALVIPQAIHVRHIDVCVLVGSTAFFYITS